MNAFKSRSTIVCAMAFATLISVNAMALRGGFFDTTFALVSVYLCRDILLGILKHQEVSDEQNASTTTTVTTPSPVETKSSTTTETKP